jgi:hypothetical protein
VESAGIFVLAHHTGDDLFELGMRFQAVDQPARERVLRDVAAGCAYARGGLVRVGLDQSGLEIASLR